jgi:putative CocE/NonD family hydrolase
MIGGWYDHNIDNMLNFFEALRTQSPLAVREDHRMLMGPWTHSGVGELLQGELTYPDAVHADDSMALMYFDFHLRSISNGWDQSPVVKYFQMGENSWHSDVAWTTPSSTNFYLHGNGSLKDSPPVSATDNLSFSYDPDDPSPTIGGPTLRVDLDQGPYAQNSIESRNDILSFTTDTLMNELVLKGNIKVHLKISSDKTDTDFAIRLTDVYPDGTSVLVNDGIARMRFRNGFTAADTSVIVPGQVYDCTIELPATAITFLAGHRLRIDISSSNYPRFNRNMNSGEDMYPAGSMDTLVNSEVAINTVYTNSINTSIIELPLINYVSSIWDKTFENDFTIFPNPSDGAFKIQSITNKEYKLKIYNSLGKLVYERSFISSVKVTDINLPAGNYFVRIIYDKGNKEIVKRVQIN